MSPFVIPIVIFPELALRSVLSNLTADECLRLFTALPFQRNIDTVTTDNIHVKICFSNGVVVDIEELENKGACKTLPLNFANMSYVHTLKKNPFALRWTNSLGVSLVGSSLTILFDDLRNKQDRCNTLKAIADAAVLSSSTITKLTLKNTDQYHPDMKNDLYLYPYRMLGMVSGFAKIIQSVSATIEILECEFDSLESYINLPTMADFDDDVKFPKLTTALMRACGWWIYRHSPALRVVMHQQTCSTVDINRCIDECIKYAPQSLEEFGLEFPGMYAYVDSNAILRRLMEVVDACPRLHTLRILNVAFSQYQGGTTSFDDLKEYVQAKAIRILLK